MLQALSDFDDVSQSADGFGPSSSVLPQLIDILQCLAVWKIVLFMCYRPRTEITNGILLAGSEGGQMTCRLKSCTPEQIEKWKYRNEKG